MSKEITKYNNNDIVEQVKGIAGEDADDLAVMSYLAQVSATAQLVKMRKIEESKIPTAGVSFEWSLTTAIEEIRLPKPWISFSLLNNGPGDIRMTINTLKGGIGREAIIRNGAAVSRDFKYPVMTGLYWATTAGLATVSVQAEEGEWA